MSADAAIRAPPPFFVLSFRRSSDGRLVADETDRQDQGVDVPSAKFLDSAPSNELGAAVDGILQRLESGQPGWQQELTLDNPRDQGRMLHCRIDGVRGADGRPFAIAVVHKLPPWPAKAAETSIRSAMIRAEVDESGQAVLRFEDHGIRQLTTLDPAAFARSKPGQEILARARQIDGLATWSADLALNEMTLEGLEPGAPALQCRFFRGTAPGGVGVLLHDLPPTPALPSRGAVDDLLRLLRIAAVLLESPSLQRGLADIAAVVVEHPLLLSVAIALIESGRLRLRASAGPERPLAAGLGAEAVQARTIMQQTASGGEPAICAVPIEAGDDILGVLELRWLESPGIGPWQQEIIGSYADYIAAFVTRRPARPRALRGRTGSDELDLTRLLTPRQQQVLFTFVNTGYANRELSQALQLAEGTVKVHMREIMQRLGVDRRSEALRSVYRRAPRWLAEMRRRHGAESPDRSTS